MKKVHFMASPMLLSVVGCTAAFCILVLNEGGNSQNIAQWVVGLAAGIGILGTAIVVFFQLKRDGKTIDQISSTANSINLTTTVAKEKIDQIPGISAAVKSIADRNIKIDEIAKELEFQKRLRTEHSYEVDRDQIITGMSAVFEENTMLKAQLKESKNQIVLDQVRIFQLNEKLNEKDQLINKLTQQLNSAGGKENENME